MALQLLAWYCCPSVRPSVCLMKLCTVAKQHILQQKCLNKWIGSAPWEHNFQSPTATLSPQIPYPKTFEILPTYCILLSGSRDHFVYAATMMESIIISVMIY